MCEADKLLAKRCKSSGCCPSEDYLKGVSTRCCPFCGGCQAVTPEMWEVVWVVHRKLVEANSFYQGYEDYEVPQLSFLDTMRVRKLVYDAISIAVNNGILITVFTFYERFLIGGRPG